LDLLGVGALVSGSDEVACQVVDVALHVHEVLLSLAFNLDPPKASLGEFLWVIDINNFFLLFISLDDLVSFQLDSLLRLFVFFEFLEGVSHHHFSGESSCFKEVVHVLGLFPGHVVDVRHLVMVYIRNHEL
jgi:hypothetical protein